MKKPRMHEWAYGDVGRRTVCGLTGAGIGREQPLVAANAGGVTVHDLGDVDVADRCKNCERMRATIGTSKRPKGPAAG
jgi:hypothetical protein